MQFSCRCPCCKPCIRASLLWKLWQMKSLISHCDPYTSLELQYLRQSPPWAMLEVEAAFHLMTSELQYAPEAWLPWLLPQYTVCPSSCFFTTISPLQQHYWSLGLRSHVNIVICKLLAILLESLPHSAGVTVQGWLWYLSSSSITTRSEWLGLTTLNIFTSWSVSDPTTNGSFFSYYSRSRRVSYIQVGLKQTNTRLKTVQMGEKYVGHKTKCTILLWGTTQNSGINACSIIQMPHTGLWETQC